MPCQQPFRSDSSQLLLFKIASCLAEGGAGVSSFNGRTGAVTLTYGDVVDALGCVPVCEGGPGSGVESFNGRNGVVTLTEADVAGVADSRYVLKAGDTMTGSLNIANSAPLVASDPALDITQTWNNAAVTFTGLQSNITNTASSTNSNLFNFQVDGVDRFNFTPGGSLRAVRQDASDSGMNLFLRKRGNAGGATNAVAADSTIGSVAYSAWDGTGFFTGSRVSGLASEAWTAIAHGSRIDLYTTPLGSVTEQIALRLSHTGQAQFLDGTAALPSLTFQSDPDTGIYRIGANTLAISTSGVAALRVDPEGDVGIGVDPGVFRLYTYRLATGVATGFNIVALFENDITMTGAGTSDITPLAVTLNFRGSVNQTDTLKGASGQTINAFNHNTATVTQFSGWRNDVRNLGTGTISNMQGIWIRDMLNSGGGVVTNAYGIRIDDITPGVNNYGYFSMVSAGALKYNLYISGTAQNYFAGMVGIGTVSPSSGLSLGAAVSLAIYSGANQRAGDAVLVGGTVTVANTTVTANTRVYLTRKVTGGTIGFAVTYTIIAATSFTITSDNVLDTSTYSYLLIEVP